MQNRRDFLRSSALGATMVSLASTVSPTPGISGGDGGFTSGSESSQANAMKHSPQPEPLVVSTWRHGLPANEAAWQVLADGGTALDSVETGVRVTEADPKSTSVGLGGLPDREGVVTLDACIMDGLGRCGSVAFLQNIVHPISVARLVMEKTPHVMLVGEGARQFALARGFKEQNLLTPESKAAWQEWLRESRYEPEVNVENHDTISMLSIDTAGNLAGACTTSGLAYKMHGRVGDSPIIGAALFVDGEVGAACATGHGELVMRTLGSFLVVELMRQGMTPQEACRCAIERIVAGNDDLSQMQVGYLAISRQGEVGAFGIHPGFNYAWHTGEDNTLHDAASWL